MAVRVLLVDKHVRMRNALRLLLNGESGIEVVAAVVNGAQAVELAVRYQPEVAVVDFSLLDLGGLDVVREITRVSPATRVLILSLCFSAEHVRQARQAGACGWVLKESAASEIATAIRAIAGGEEYFTEPLAVSTR